MNPHLVSIVIHLQIYQRFQYAEEQTMAHRKISRFIPRDQKWLIACLIAVSSVDSVVCLSPCHIRQLPGAANHQQNAACRLRQLAHG